MKCGYNGCCLYVEVIVVGDVNYNQCLFGGVEGIVCFVNLFGKLVILLNFVNGIEYLCVIVFIDENLCIGCMLCMQVCLVDVIVGVLKQMYMIVVLLCMGCDLCVLLCLVDCIVMLLVIGDCMGWEVWLQEQVDVVCECYDLCFVCQCCEGEVVEVCVVVCCVVSVMKLVVEFIVVQFGVLVVVLVVDDVEVKKCVIIVVVFECVCKKKEELFG